MWNKLGYLKADDDCHQNHMLTALEAQIFCHLLNSLLTVSQIMILIMKLCEGDHITSHTARGDLKVL